MERDSRHLMWGGCDAVELAGKYGTPAYLMDQGVIEDRIGQYLSVAGEVYADLRVAYAGKAFLCGMLVQMLEAKGLWLDVVSGGELHLALAAGFDPQRVFFHGNNKSDAEIAYGLEAGVGRFVVDNLAELGRLSSQASSRGLTQDILLRVTPGISPRTHRAVQTGQVDSKFGLPVTGGAALAAVKAALAAPGIRLRGVHLHIGSQISEVHPFRTAARAAAQLAWEIWRETGYLPQEVNLGGGWAAGLLPGQPLDTIGSYVAAVARSFKAAWRRCGVPGVPLGSADPAAAGAGGRSSPTGSARYVWPTLYIEPGRSIVADAGITLYTVGAVKPVPGFDPYVLVDGGMNDNPRPALYGARYHAVLANRPAEPAERTYTLVGKACESGDVLIRELPLPEPTPGDIMAVFATGAYNHSMASNYNRLERPPVVFVREGESRLAVRRETYVDMLLTDMAVERG